MKNHLAKNPVRNQAQQAFSLVEILVAILLAGILISALVGGFGTVIGSSESSAYSLAAQACALQTYEQVRAAKWDAVSFPAVDELVASNFPPRVSVLDIPQSGTNLVFATNFTTITTISTNPLLKLVRVDCVYSFMGRQPCTNSIVSYRTTETGQQNAVASPAPPPATPPPPVTGTTIKPNKRGRGGKGNN